jgi:urease gamma subunit
MGAGASSARIEQLQRQIAAEAAQRRHQEDKLMLNDPETVAVLKEQVQECLKHVRSLNEKLASGKYAPDSPELKAGVDALRAVLSKPSPKKAAAAAATSAPAPASDAPPPAPPPAQEVYFSYGMRPFWVDDGSSVARSLILSLSLCVCMCVLVWIEMCLRMCVRLFI